MEVVGRLQDVLPRLQLAGLPVADVAQLLLQALQLRQVLLVARALTLDPAPVLNPSEENFRRFPTYLSQLPVPETVFSAFPPANDGNHS